MLLQNGEIPLDKCSLGRKYISGCKCGILPAADRQKAPPKRCFRELFIKIMPGVAEDMSTDLSPYTIGGADTAIELYLLGKHIGPIQGAVNGLILRLTRLGRL